jgi:hypothetical protein
MAATFTRVLSLAGLDSGMGLFGLEADLSLLFRTNRARLDGREARIGEGEREVRAAELWELVADVDRLFDMNSSLDSLEVYFENEENEGFGLARWTRSLVDVSVVGGGGGGGAS